MKARRRIRVLVVDDSVTVRRVVTEALAQDAALHVVGSAANGEEAIGLIRPLRPDVIILDLEMPVCDGIEALERIKADHPDLPVLVFSATGSQAAERTLQALWLGASDYVPKPAAGSLSAALNEVREELVWRIKAVAQHHHPAHEPRGLATGVAPVDPPGRRPAPPASLVVIGASTGGPQALAALIERLPRDLGAPIAVVQHLPSTFTAHFVAGLARRSRLRVRVAEHDATLEPGHVWIAPGDRHLEIARTGARLHLALHDGPPENACRPSVDPLFRSAADLVGPRVLGVILTGMGKDGLDGCRRLREAHGSVIAQDEASSVVWGMPGAVVRAGFADLELPLRRIADEIAERTRRPGTRTARERAA